MPYKEVPYLNTMSRLTIMLLALLLGGSLCAQPNSTDPDEARRWKPGYIISLHDDTVHGRIKDIRFLDVYYDYQRRVAFESEGVITEYVPVELKGFALQTEEASKPVLMVLESVSDPREGGGHIFSRVFCTGACKVYGYTVTLTRESEAMISSGKAIAPSLLAQEKKYIQLGHGDFIPLKFIGFKKSMRDLFTMCPVILARLENKQYTYENWQAMVHDYNCGICK